MPIKNKRGHVIYKNFADCVKKNKSWATSPEGFCAKKEFEYTGLWPSQMYAREKKKKRKR